MKLKIGARERKPGYTHLDIDPATDPDIVADVTHIPLPNDSVDFVYMESVLEHVPDMLAVMKELHRVLTPGGQIEIWLPHWSGFSVPAHLEHKRGGSYFMFEKGKEKEYGFHFKILDRRILIEGRLYPQIKKPTTRWKYLIMPLEWVANKKPTLFERLLCYWVGGAEAVYFRLEAVK